VALAGFTPEVVTLTAEQNVLTLEGKKTEKEEKALPASGHLDPKLQAPLHPWADHVEDKGARFENGLLLVELQREIPEAIVASPPTAPRRARSLRSRPRPRNLPAAWTNDAARALSRAAAPLRR